MAKEKVRDNGGIIHADVPESLQIFRDKVSNKVQAVNTKYDDSFISGKELRRLRKNVDWNALDPLRDDYVTPETRIESTRQVEYLGVMVDAARYYFEIDWLKRLVIYLHRLNFNLVHLRLADDENFIVRLKSYPELKYSMTGDFYTPEQLQSLVIFAKQYNVTIIPEVSMPLNGGSWAGIPGLIVPCPNHVCETGRSVPLNISHAEFPHILKGILKEIVMIFESPPMLHLGGSVSSPTENICLEEAGLKNRLDWSLFEDTLKAALKEIDYPEARVIRFQDPVEGGEDGFDLTQRIGGIEHYLFDTPPPVNYSERGIEIPKAKTMIVTAALDFTMDDDNHALHIYSLTLDALNLPQKPKAIIVGALYLSPDFWVQRNVASRLIAVSMAANRSNRIPLVGFANSYKSTCRFLLGPSSARICDLQGRITVEDDAYLNKQMEQNNDWRRGMCDRLTYSNKQRVFMPHIPIRSYAAKMGNEVFWRTFHQPIVPRSQNKKARNSSKTIGKVQRFGDLRVKKAGVILDLASSLVRPQRVLELLDTYVAQLGLNMMQLRFQNDNVFAVRLEGQQLGNPASSQENYIAKLSEFVPIVEAGSELGIDVFPEINIATDAGGWVKGGYLVHCPRHYCTYGENIPNDIRQPQFLAVVYAVLKELREIFSISPYFHLGSDERVENQKCLGEDDRAVDGNLQFGSFETKLERLIAMLGIKAEHVLRWNNREQRTYNDRAGRITHYRADDNIDFRANEPFFVTVDILQGTVYDVYKRTTDLMRLKPEGIMGEIRALGEEEWRSLHIGVRLIAFAVGLTANDALSQEGFREVILKACRETSFPEYKDEMDCRNFEAGPYKSKGQIQMDGTNHTEVRLEMCYAYTREKDMHYMKSSFVASRIKVQ